MAKLKFQKLAAFPGFPPSYRAQVRGLGTFELFQLGGGDISIERVDEEGNHKQVYTVETWQDAKRLLQQVEDASDDERAALIAKQAGE